MIRDGGAARLLAAGLGLGWAFDALFSDQRPGVSALVFVALLLGALAALGRAADVRVARRNLWLLAPAGYCAAMVGVRAEGFLTLLNVLTVLALLGLIAAFYAGGRVERLGLAGYPAALARTVGHALIGPARLLPEGVDLPQAGRATAPAALPVLRGVLLALPVLVVFSALLASSDFVFADLLGATLTLDIWGGLMNGMGHVVVTLVVGWLLAGGLAYALRRFHGEAAGRPAAGAPPLRLGLIEAATVLALTDALLLVFGWVQATYLFGGGANIAARGYTYAEYARRGFFELVVVAALALGLLLALQAVTPRAGRRQVLLFNGLSSLLVALVLVLVAAALRRMGLYEDAYGYTRLRLYVHVFMLGLAGVFLWFLITLWLRPARFAIGAFLTGLGMLVALNTLDPDATIAAQNLARFDATGRLDVAYLTALDEDATPALLAALDRLPPAAQGALRARLGAQRAALMAAQARSAWPAFNLARDAAYRALLPRADLLPPRAGN
jgi:hypothetical protein